MDALQCDWGGMHVDLQPGTAPALVMCNSLGTDLRMWDGVLASLPQGRSCLRMDKRGHGLSDRAPGPYGLSDLAGDVLAAMDHAGQERAVILGCSIGGLIALHLALMAPDRVLALVLSNTAPKLGTPEMWAARTRGVEERGMEAMSAEIIPRWFGPDMLNRSEARLWHNLLQRTDPQGYVAACEAIAGADVTARLGEITQPALVVGGRHDKTTPPETVLHLKAALPCADFVLFERSGHLPAIEEPAAFAGILNEFMERVAA